VQKELETTRHWAQLASKTLFSEEKLRAQALAEAEATRQTDIQRLREEIQSLVE